MDRRGPRVAPGLAATRLFDDTAQALADVATDGRALPRATASRACRSR
ncbi:hypothetical protein ACFPM0_23825 [Pseudonocardia sulfidoxydans]